MKVRFCLPFGLLLLFILAGCKSPQKSTPPLQSPAPPTQQAVVEISPTATLTALAPSPTIPPTEAATVEAGGAQPSPSPTPQPTTVETQPPTPTQDSGAETAETVGNTGSGCSNLATFSQDVTIPDDTMFRQGETFVKTWELYNSGTCAWSSGYQAVFSYGDPLGSTRSIDMPETPPGALVRVSADMVAPTTPGQYTGNWQLKSASGEQFGVGIHGTDYFWVKINVSYVGSGEEGSSDTEAQTPAPTTTSSGCSYTPNPEYLDEITAQINQIRLSYGLDSLTVNPQLSAAATSYSLDMACNNRVDFTRHTDSNGGRWYERISAQGYSYSVALEIVWAGNPAYGGTPQAAINWWMNSRIHRDNILNPEVTEIGVAYAYVENSEFRGYYTVDFAKP